MNNKTIHNFTIKLRGDHVFDLYVDGALYTSKGSYIYVLSELKKIMEGMPYESNP